MTDPARLVLVRHALPADHGVKVFGSLDVALGDKGFDQADRLADRLAGFQIAAIYSSPLVRALHTARPLAERLGLGPVVVPDLREIDFGELEGLTFQEVADRHSKLLRWVDAPAEVAFPQGESVAALARRAIAAGRAIAAAHAAETVVVVSHAVTLRAILGDALRMPLDAIFRLELTHCGISLVDWFGDRPLVRYVNAPN